MRLGFLCRAGPLDDRLWLRKISSCFLYCALNMPYPTGKIIATYRMQPFIGKWFNSHIAVAIRYVSVPRSLPASLLQIGSAVPLSLPHLRILDELSDGWNG